MRKKFLLSSCISNLLRYNDGMKTTLTKTTKTKLKTLPEHFFIPYLDFQKSRIPMKRQGFRLWGVFIRLTEHSPSKPPLFILILLLLALAYYVYCWVFLFSR